MSRESLDSEASELTEIFQKRMNEWANVEVPFGSEQDWDSTGQEGVYFWSSVAGNDHCIEHQIHHYGPGLNTLVMLSSFRDDPSDSYMLRVGYGRTTGPLSNIDQDGFASCAMHAWPQSLYWDAYSGDYSPNFVGMALCSGTYIADDLYLGLVAYGGDLSIGNNEVYIRPLRTEIKINARVIETVSYNKATKEISVTLGYLSGAPRAEGIVVWVEPNAGLTHGVDSVPEVRWKSTN